MLCSTFSFFLTRIIVSLIVSLRVAVENLENGAVATDDGRCSELGKQILQQGGNAVDAAVTVTLCLGIVNPAGSTPGGGCMILLHSEALPDRESGDFIDARTRTCI